MATQTIDKSPLVAMIALVKADAALSARIGGNVYVVVAPEDAEPPFIIINRVGGDRRNAFAGPTGFANARLQFTAWARTYAEVDAMSMELSTLLDGYDGTIGGVTIKSVTSILGPIDQHDPDTTLLGQITDFSVWYDDNSG